jgi:hypothetical protein
MTNREPLLKRLCVALLAIYALWFAFNSYTRTRQFDDGDTMNSRDVARHIASAQGVTQATLGFNQPHFNVDDPIPTPLTHQPPLYPLMIASVSQAGLSLTDSALLISVVSYALALVAGYRAVLLLFGETEALGALLLLAAYSPLRDFSDSAFSDPPGIALMLAAFWVLAHYSNRPRRRAHLALLAGWIAACGVATRYALAPLLAVAGLFVFVRATRRLRDSILFMIGPGIIGILLVWRNLTILQGSVMPHFLHLHTGLVANFFAALGTLAGDYADWGSRLVRIALLAVVILIALWLARRRGQLAATLHGVSWKGSGSAFLVTFGLTYCVFLIVLRSHSSIDPIGPRYMLPGAVTFLLLFAVFVVRATGINLGRLAGAGAVVGLGLIAYEANATFVTPAYSAERRIAQSERLTWVQKNTTRDDLIIGEDSVVFPFYFDRTVAVSYSLFPSTEILPYDKTLQLCRRFKPLYSRVLLIIPQHPTSREPGGVNWDFHLGPFIEALNRGRTETYPAVTPLAVLADGRVFQLSC